MLAVFGLALTMVGFCGFFVYSLNIEIVGAFLGLGLALLTFQLIQSLRVRLSDISAASGQAKRGFGPRSFYRPRFHEMRLGPYHHSNIERLLREKRSYLKGMSMRRTFFGLVLLLNLTLGSPGLVFSQDSPKQDIKDAGHDAKNAAKDTGRATKDTAKKTGHEVKQGTNKAASKTEEGAQKVKDKTDPD